MCMYIYIYNIYTYTYGSRKIIRCNGSIEKSARTLGLTRAHKVYGAVGWV